MTFDIKRRGAWLVTAVHMIPAPRGADAQWESIWASLSFERPRGKHMKPAIFLLMSLLVCAACLDTAGAAGWIGPDEKLSGKYNARDLDRLLEENKLAGGENIKVVMLSRNTRSANMLVQVRDREPLHRHADSDITVFLLRGAGELRIGKQMRPVKSGDVMHIPRGAVHAYINRGPEPAAALVVYSPAPGPKDRILVEDKP